MRQRVLKLPIEMIGTMIHPFHGLSYRLRLNHLSLFSKRPTM